MKIKSIITLTILGTFLLLTGAACSHEISHTESDKPGWFGGRTRSETTVYENANGTTSTEHSTQTTK